MECRVIFYFQELTNIQAGDVVGISSRQKSVFRIGQLRTYLQEVGRGDLIGRDIEPDVVAGLLHTQQRRTQIEAGAFEVMEIPHTVE